MARLNSPSERSNNTIPEGGESQSRDFHIGLYPVAQLSTIKLAGLQHGDGEEAEKLFRGAREDGFFYLNFQDSAFEGMINLVEDIFTISKRLFNLDNQEKMEYDIDKLGNLKLNGYKPIGRNYGGVNGKRDGFESYAIPGKIKIDPSFRRPSLLTDHLPTLETFTSTTHRVLNLLLQSLSSSLQLPPESALINLHREHSPSPDIVRFLKYHAQPPNEQGYPQAPHTDLGSLTILFAHSPGLQVLRSSSSDWAYVLPKPGHAIVNIGDGLTRLTNGLLRSCLHRVAPIKGQSMTERYSFAYLQRAEYEVRMTGLTGSDIIPVKRGNFETEQVCTSREWLGKKFGMLRKETFEEGTEGSWVLTGQREEVPV